MGVPPEERALKATQRREFDRLRKNGLSVAAAARETQISRQSGYRWERTRADRVGGTGSRTAAAAPPAPSVGPWGTGAFIGNRQGRPPSAARELWGRCVGCGVAQPDWDDRFMWVVIWDEVHPHRFLCDTCHPQILCGECEGAVI